MTQGLPYRPTEEQRRTVRAMSGYGIPQEDIATFFDIDAKTLRKHFRNEIDKGSIEATSKVAQSLFRMATEGKNVAAAIFWMKARAGWREKQQVEHGFTPGAVISGGYPPEEMTDEELMRIIRLEQDRDDDDPRARSPRRRTSFAIDMPPEMTAEEWTERFAPKPKP
ncbi:hypothetical protein EJV46_01010 [Roseococcus sp. SYP-B2431]|nr:hypothetical protein [Roseococcus sp. SYP-B2431]TCI00789.1 hypothetical protein EJV46_01010 [Roseococcus sp. SYP-B2431]